MNNNIPNLFIIGAPKAGTTSLVATLKDHPDVFVPKEKEPRYFDASIFFDFEEDYPVKNKTEYLKKYQSQESLNSKYRVDGSVFNMYSIESIQNILSMSPDAKFILVIREPLSAVKSMYSQRMKYIIPQLREVSKNFNDCWQLSKKRKNGENFPKGCRNKFIFRYDLLYSYEKYLPQIIELLDKDKLHLASFEELQSNPSLFYEKVFNFLSFKTPPFFESKKKNISYIQETTFFTHILGIVSFKTYKFRKKIGLNGTNVNLIRNILYRKNSTSPEISTKSDIDIKLYFKKTYKYLDTLSLNKDV